MIGELLGEFSSRTQHHRHGALLLLLRTALLAFTLVLLQPLLHDGNTKRQRLSGTGLRLANDVLSCNNLWDRTPLNRGRLGKA